jgi:hypothetical protein
MAAHAYMPPCRSMTSLIVLFCHPRNSHTTWTTLRACLSSKDFHKLFLPLSTTYSRTSSNPPSAPSFSFSPSGSPAELRDALAIHYTFVAMIPIHRPTINEPANTISHPMTELPLDVLSSICWSLLLRGEIRFPGSTMTSISRRLPSHLPSLGRSVSPLRRQRAT